MWNLWGHIYIYTYHVYKYKYIYIIPSQHFGTAPKLSWKVPVHNQFSHRNCCFWSLSGSGDAPSRPICPRSFPLVRTSAFETPQENSKTMDLSRNGTGRLCRAILRLSEKIVVSVGGHFFCRSCDGDPPRSHGSVAPGHKEHNLSLYIQYIMWTFMIIHPNINGNSRILKWRYVSTI